MGGNVSLMIIGWWGVWVGFVVLFVWWVWMECEVGGGWWWFCCVIDLNCVWIRRCINEIEVIVFGCCFVCVGGWGIGLGSY